MRRLTVRAITASAAGALIAFTTGGCSSGDPLADYVADVRGVLSEGDNAAINDNGIIFAGKMICGMREQAEANPASFGLPEVVELALANCEVLATADPTPGDGSPAGDAQGLAGERDANAGERLSDRGAIPSAAGERIELWGPPQAPEPGQYVIVTAIRPVTSCKGNDVGDRGQSIPAVPENGRFLAVDMTIENTATYDTAQSGYYAGSAQQYDFVAADGTALDDVDTLVAFYCTGEEDVFYNLKPGRTYTATKYIDVSRDAGWLVFGQTTNAGPGYEFEVPAA
jgi:hypothetical protein